MKLCRAIHKLLSAAVSEDSRVLNKKTKASALSVEEEDNDDWDDEFNEVAAAVIHDSCKIEAKGMFAF